MGKIAKEIHHVPCLPISQYIDQLRYCEFSELVQKLSCFIPIYIHNECKTNDSIQDIYDLYEKFYNYEGEYYTEENYELQFDMMPFLQEWTQIENMEECHGFFQKLENEKMVTIGNFISIEID